MSEETQKPERIAKVMARAGVASRREVERMIEAGRVTVNGHGISSPALNVTPTDTITLDGKVLAKPARARLFRFHKPVGLVTTTHDEKGRKTVFDALPENLPRLMSIGRLDITSEGLLLLTNDGELKRKLELPSTGWSRKYRVRVNGTPDEAALAPLRKGPTIDGTRYKPMQISIDRQQGSNAWLTIRLEEGKNREIRRAMEHLGLKVNRLIRVSYGPFQLGELKSGETEEIRAKALQDQLGIAAPQGTAQKKKTGPKKPSRTLNPRAANPSVRLQAKPRKPSRPGNGKG